MKKKSWKNFVKHLAATGFAVMMMGTLSVTASAATCDNCGCSENFYIDRYNVSVHMITPDEHYLDVTNEYLCYGCRETFFVHETIAECHDYHLDYDTNMLICDECGDSYGAY